MAISGYQNQQIINWQKNSNLLLFLSSHHSSNNSLSLSLFEPFSRALPLLGHIRAFSSFTSSLTCLLPLPRRRRVFLFLSLRQKSRLSFRLRSGLNRIREEILNVNAGPLPGRSRIGIAASLTTLPSRLVGLPSLPRTRTRPPKHSTPILNAILVRVRDPFPPTIDFRPIPIHSLSSPRRLSISGQMDRSCRFDNPIGYAIARVCGLG